MNSKILAIEDDSSNKMEVFINGRMKVTIVINRDSEKSQMVELEDSDVTALIKELRLLSKA